MSSLVWSDALSVSFPVMDTTHREFVELLDAVQAASDETLLPRWQALIEHTAEHFAREDRWMQTTGFAPGNCHATQHAVVLKVLRDSLDIAAAAQLSMIRQMAKELGRWFPQHAQSMDAALALHLKGMGFDPDTGTVLHEDRLPAQAITGCGGACGTAA